MAEFLVSFDPRSLSPEQYRAKFVEFLEEYEMEQLQKLLLINCPSDRHHSFLVDCPDLIHFDSALSYSVLQYPLLLLPILEEAVRSLQFSLHQHPAFFSKWKQRGQIKTNVHVRLLSIPSVCDLSKATIGDVRSGEVNSLIQLAGTVVRTGGVRMLELSKQYECLNPKCRYRFTVTADPEQDHMLPQPRSCPSPADASSHRPSHTTAPSGNRGVGSGSSSSGGGGGRGSSKASKCNSVNLREIEGSRVCVDYQEIKVQDHVERLGLGSVPRSIVVLLKADLVDRFNPGDDVVVVGTIVRRWRPVVRGMRCTVTLAVEANSVVAANAAEQHVTLSDVTAAEFAQFWRTYRDAKVPFQARNMIVRSVCPQLFGMYQVKLALLLVLIGGSSGSGSGGGSGGSSAGTASGRSGGRGGGDANNSSCDDGGDFRELAADDENDVRAGNCSSNGGVAAAADSENRGVHRRSQIHMLMVGKCLYVFCTFCACSFLCTAEWFRGCWSAMMCCNVRTCHILQVAVGTLSLNNMAVLILENA